MGIFKSGKTLPERAQEERAKLDMMKTRVQQEKTSRELMMERRRRAEELKRLTA